MTEIFNLMLDNLRNAGIGILIFLLAYIANISFSLYYNIKVLGQNFNKEQMWNSFLRIITFAVGTCCLVVVITALPLFANYMGLPLPDDFVNNLTMVAIIGFPLYLASKYAMMAFEKMKKVLESGTITLSNFEEEAIESVSLEEVENNKKVYNKIVNGLKEIINEEEKEILHTEESKEKLDKLVELSEELNKSDKKENVTSTIVSPIIKPLNQEKLKEVINQEVPRSGTWPITFSPLNEEEKYTSQDVPDEVNMEEMEKEQVKG